VVLREQNRFVGRFEKNPCESVGEWKCRVENGVKGASFM